MEEHHSKSRKKYIMVVERTIFIQTKIQSEKEEENNQMRDTLRTRVLGK